MTVEGDALKAKGNDLFKEGKTDEAIEMYSKAIELDKTNHIYFSNRSAAYLTKNDATKALDDANTCLELNPDFEKGYSRKGAALQGLKKFDEAIAVLEEGVAKFPENSNLQKELATVKLVKDSGSSMAQTARSSKASMMAAGSRKKKAAESENLSSFVQETKFALELQIFALQAQLDLVNGLAALTDEEKMRLMFQIVDTDHDKKIDARELADAIKRHNADLTFAESVDRAINYVAAFDDDHDARLDFQEFTNFLNTLADTLGVDFHEIAELLILQNLFSDTGTTEIEGIAGEIAAEAIDATVLEKEVVFDVMSDPRMVSLFALFDKDGTGDINFREAAIGLWQITDNMEESSKAAVNILLTMTQDDERTLDYEKFSQLILSIVSAAGITFNEAADAMTLSMVQDKAISPDDLINLMVGEAVYSEVVALIEEETEAMEILDALQLGRLQKLFDLWDEDADGQISFEELVNGMRKFQGQMEVEESVQRASLLIIGFDEDQSQSLNKIEFAKAMVKYANTAGVPLEDLVDFMCVVSVMEENSPQEKAFFHKIAPEATAAIKQIESEMARIGIE